MHDKGEGEVIILKVYWTPLCIFPYVVLRISVKLEVGSQEVVLILDIQGDDGGI